MSEPEKQPCRCVILKRRVLGLTKFQPRCEVCGWDGPSHGREKARVAAQIHESGGKIIGWDVPAPRRNLEPIQ